MPAVVAAAAVAAPEDVADLSHCINTSFSSPRLLLSRGLFFVHSNNGCQSLVDVYFSGVKLLSSSLFGDKFQIGQELIHLLSMEINSLSAQGDLDTEINRLSDVFHPTPMISKFSL